MALVLSGELDIATAPAMRERLAIHPPAGTELLVDLRGVTFMDCSALRVLLEAQEASRQEGWALRVAVAPGPVQRLIELTGTARLLASESDAVAA